MRRRLALIIACASALALALPAVSLGAHSLRFTIGKFEPSPGRYEYLEGPCGLAVDSHGDLYASDYYHDKIDVFSSSGSFITQISGVDPLDGPCGLAVDSAGRIYANVYHGGVLKLTPSAYPPTSATTYSTPVGVIEGVDATGIALDPVGGNLLVDERSSLAEYAAPVGSGAEPLRRIGAGTLADGYGLAVSGYTGTEGFLYVADAASSTVEVFDPATSTTTPVATIDGSETALGRFDDLADAALAIDDSDGHLYVVDEVEGALFEHPPARVEEFDEEGNLVGELEPDIVDGEPVGLAVDEGTGATKGDLYVTDGNSEDSSVLAFGPTPGLAALASATGSGTVAAGPQEGFESAAEATTAAAVTPVQAGRKAGTPARTDSLRPRSHRSTRPCRSDHLHRALCRVHRTRKGRRRR